MCDRIRETRDSKYLINIKTGRKIGRESNVVKKIWIEWFKNNKDDLSKKIINRRQGKNTHIYTYDIIIQLKIDKNDRKEIVYNEDITNIIMEYMEISIKSEMRKVCKKWSDYVYNTIIKDLYNEGKTDNKILDKYIKENMRKLEKVQWKNFMQRTDFDSWKYFCYLQIHQRYDIIDIFYEQSKHLPKDHRYYTKYTFNSNEVINNVNIHIKYTRFPLILCIIYLKTEYVFQKELRYQYLDYLKSIKYFDLVIPEDCSSLSYQELCDKILLYYPDPYCLIPNSCKTSYSYEYNKCVEKLYNF